MSETFQALTLTAAVVATVERPVAARAQSAPQPGVDPPRVELAAAVRVTQIASGGDRTWGGPGLALTIDRNASPHLAAAVQVETDFHHATGFLGGARVATGCYHGSGRDPVPGRFFARVLAGAVNGQFAGVHPAGQVAIGADVRLSRTRPVGLRWEVGYELTAGKVPGHANGRLAIGTVPGVGAPPCRGSRMRDRRLR
jgi:hypothetical protein